MKNPERRKFVSNFDQDVFDYALEDACVKVANVKSVKKCSPGRRPQAPTRTPCVYRFIVPVRGHLIIVCGAPWPTAWLGKIYTSRSTISSAACFFLIFFVIFLLLCFAEYCQSGPSCSEKAEGKRFEARVPQEETSHETEESRRTSFEEGHDLNLTISPRSYYLFYQMFEFYLSSLLSHSLLHTGYARMLTRLVFVSAVCHLSSHSIFTSSALLFSLCPASITLLAFFLYWKTFAESKDYVCLFAIGFARNGRSR